MTPNPSTGANPSTPSARNWAYTTRTFQALGHRFAVRSTCQGIGRYLEEMYDACVATGGPDTWYSVVDEPTSGLGHALYINDRLVLVEAPSASWVLKNITWHVNHSVVTNSPDYVLVHAGAVARGGVGVLLPGAMDAGKTTLVAGLIRVGFKYLTDEAAAVDPASLMIHPFPKPLSIDPGSFEVLGDLRPRLDERTARYVDRQWQVPVASIQTGAVSGPVKPRFVVFPRYVAGAPTKLDEFPRSRILVELLRHTFNFHEGGRRKFDVLAQVVEGSRCFRLTSGRLDEACAEVSALVDGKSPSRVGTVG